MSVLLEIGYSEEEPIKLLKNTIQDILGGVSQSYSTLKPLCVRCQSDLFLLAQFKTLIGASLVRVLYVFGCNHCESSSESFTVYRLNYSPVQKKAEASSKKQEPSPPPTRPTTPLIPFPSFGSPAAASFGTGSGTSLAELNSLLKSTTLKSSLLSKSNQIPSPTTKKGQSKDKTQTPTIALSTTSNAFPAYPLYFEEAEDTSSANSNSKSTKNNPSISTSLENDHVSRLLAEYREAHPDEKVDKWLALDTQRAEQSSSSLRAPKEWEDEQYEKMAIDDDKAFKKFRAFFDQFPENVIRYQYGGEPLFFTGRDSVFETLKSKGPLPCPRCQAPRIFEFQLMPPILTLLQTTSVTATVPESTSADNPTQASLDIKGMNWGTILVYVCSEDCTSHENDGKEDNAWSLSEELCYVQCE